MVLQLDVSAEDNRNILMGISICQTTGSSQNQLTHYHNSLEILHSSDTVLLPFKASHPTNSCFLFDCYTRTHTGAIQHWWRRRERWRLEDYLGCMSLKCDRPPRTGCKVAHIDLAVRLEMHEKSVGWLF